MKLGYGFTLLIFLIFEGCSGGGSNTVATIQTATNTTPSISAVNVNLTSINISGRDFGTKSTPTPVKFTNFESDTVGQVPTGWDAPNTKKSLITNLASHGGYNSLDTSALNVPEYVPGISSGEYFNRISLDMGTTIPFNSYLYLSAWLYLDKTGSTATGWNWKGPLFTSSNSPYYWVNGTTTHSAIGSGGAWYDATAPRWFNTAMAIQYSASGEAVFNYCDSPTGGNGWNADSFVFGSWQRIEWIIKTSSAAGAADGSTIINRVGFSPSIVQAQSCTTYGDTSDFWRYISLPQGFTNITGGTLNLKMYFDDVYIDNSLARIEMCDKSSWALRTHCEIQPPASWAETTINATLNLGSFSSGELVYLYVIDKNGHVNANGKSIVLP